MSAFWTTTALLALGALVAINAWSMALRRRVALLARDAHRAAAAAGLTPAVHANPLDSLQTGLTALHGATAQVRDSLAQEQDRRRRLEANLRESEERYALAIGAGDDGLWEWNLKSNEVFFSPRWKSMIGYGDHEIGSDTQEWHSRLHPDDRPVVLAQVQAHLDGFTPRYEQEQRLLHRDGRYRWVLVRAQAVRNASGAAYRMVGLATDVSARREVQQVLLELADGLTDLSGQDCYRALVEKLAAVVGTENAFLAECCEQPAQRVRMLAHWSRGSHAECVEFDLAGTPCEDVIRSASPVHMPSGAATRWPGAKASGVDGYFGLPCIDTDGTVIGHIACTGRGPMPDALPHHAILKLFAVRAAVEMERQWLQRLRATGAAPVASAA